MSGVPPVQSTPDAVAPPPRHPRFPLLDGMRAVAVFLVVTLHSWIGTGSHAFPLSGIVAHMNIGVTIFFLLSGFLLYRPFVAHRAGGPPPPAIGDYGWRRCLRILPAYWLVTVVVILVPQIDATNGSYLSQFALTFTIDGSNGYLCTGCGLEQTWSLAVEASFYLCLPLLVIGGEWAWRRWWRWWPASELTILGLLATVGMILTFGVFDGPPPALIGGTAIGYALWFVTGMMLAIASACADAGGAPLVVATIRARPGLSWLAAGTVFVAASAWLPASPFLFDQGDQIVAMLALGITSLLLLLPAIFDGGFGVANATLGGRLAAWLGLISYGIFLWHYAVIEAIGRWGPDLTFVPLLVTTLAITIPIAAASYYFVERPFLRLKNRRFRFRAPARAIPPAAADPLHDPAMAAIKEP